MNRNGLLLAKEAGHQHSLSIHQATALLSITFPMFPPIK